MTQIAPLAESWKNIALGRPETGLTEDWSKRLYNKYQNQ